MAETPDQDFRLTARRLVAAHGNRAGYIADARAQHLRDGSDSAAADVWHEVADEVYRLLDAPGPEFLSLADDPGIAACPEIVGIYIAFDAQNDARRCYCVQSTLESDATASGYDRRKILALLAALADFMRRNPGEYVIETIRRGCRRIEDAAPA